MRKFARAQIIAAISPSSGQRQAQLVDAKSNYAEGIPRRIDLQAALNMVADTYAISQDPSDYIFAVARAVTAEVDTPNPNENGDSFTRDELLRFDHRLASRVYQTFVLKPNQVNHRAENPKTARGFVLDATYNQTNPSDQYVECLLAIDAKKDPTYAKGIQKGAIDAFSMGCVAEFTLCSICGNKATSKWEFCRHISSNKMKKFEGKLAYEICGGVCFEELSAVDQPADPKALMQEVLSLQAQLDPQAQAELDRESEILVLNSRLNKLEQALQDTNMKKAASKTAQAPLPVLDQPEEMVEAQEAPLDVGPPGDDMLPFAGAEEMPLAVDEEPPMALPDVEAQAPAMPPAPMPEVPLEAQGPLPGAPSPGDINLDEYKEEKDEEQAKPLSGDEIGVMANRARKLSLKFANRYARIRVEATKAGNFRVFDEETGKGLYALRPPTRIASRKRAALFCETVLRYIAHYGLAAAMKKLHAIPYPKKAQRSSVEIDTDFPGGRVLVEEDVDVETVLSELGGSGWTVHDEDWNSGVKLPDGRWSYPLTRAGRRAQILDHSVDDKEESLGGQAPSLKDPGEDMEESRDKPPGDSGEEVESDMDEGAGEVPPSAVGDRVSDMSAAEGAGDLDSVREPDSDKRDEPKSPTSDLLADEAHDHQERLAKIQKFFERKIASLKSEWTKEKAALEAQLDKRAEQKAKAMMARFERCLHLASERQRLNREESPLKVAMADALLEPFDINDRERFQGIDIPLTAMLVERGVETGMPAHLAALLNRAREIYKYDDRLLADAERDLKRARPTPIQVAAESGSANPDLEERLLEGNPVLKSGAVEEPQDDKRMSLRAHLNRPGFVRMYEDAADQGPLR